MKEIFALYYSDIFWLRIVDFTEDEIEWAVDEHSRDFFYIESFLTLFPDNSCEDLRCCFYFPMKFQGHGDLLGWIYDLTDNIQLEEELEMQVLINALTESYWNMYL